MASTMDTHTVTAGLAAHWEQMEGALADMMARVAGETARLMRSRVTKFRSHLVDSIKTEQVSPFEWKVGPSMAYAQAVEEGRRPGKGLPRWDEPAAADIKAWLESRPYRGIAGKAGANVEPRDRYQGLSRNVRHKGVAANPYVRPTAELMQRVFPQRVEAVVRRELARANAQGGTA